MAPGFDCYSVSSLLCAEDNEDIFDEIDNVAGAEEFGAAGWSSSPSDDPHRGFNGTLPIHSRDCLALMLKKECQHMPADGYLKRLRNGVLDLGGARKEAVDWIEKAHAHFNFGPLTAYLSINYLDRFLSAHDLPKGEDWIRQLLAVVCLSLAAKMEEPEVPLFLDLQLGQSKFIFEASTVQRIELSVLSALKWRMEAVTPFSFLDYFLRKLSNDETLSRSAISHSTQLILSTLKGIHFLEFRPSEVAAAVALSISSAKEAHMAMDDEEAASVLTQYVHKERMMKCVKMINDLSLISGFLPRSPSGVLCSPCLSCESDDAATIVGPSADYSPNEPDSKRRKLNVDLGHNGSLLLP